MEHIVWTGKTMRATVKRQSGGLPGSWKHDTPREVYAIGYQGGSTKILVADDEGKLQWLTNDQCTILSGENQVIPRRR
jgi:hypothetical protein